MGNIMPLDSAKKQQIEDIAQEFLAKFGTEFVLAYGTEFAKMKLKEIDEATCGEEERKKELMYRKKLELTDPHKMGYLTKQGAIVKNWKRRYFVVNPDYTVNYYETEEAYEKGSKPKGLICLAGYQIEEDADNAEVERLKALRKILGLKEEDIPLPDKYPEHTFELMHERRRAYYITAEDENDKKEWLEMFKTCCDKTVGLKNKDPLAQAAFKTAYYRACRESCWYKRYGECGGTEEQILSETIVEIINYRVLSSTYSSLTGNFTIRKKVREQVMKALDSIVLAMVIPSYKGLVETTQSLKVPVEKSIDEKKDEIVGVQKKITEQLSDKMETIVIKAVEEVIANIKKMFNELKELKEKASDEMRKECVVGLIGKLIEETKKSKDVEETIQKHYKAFDKVALSLLSWKYWYKVYNIEQKNIAIINKYKDTFDQSCGYQYLYLSHGILSQMADAAFFTFEEMFKDRSKSSELDLKDNTKTAELMECVKNDVLPKYDHDTTQTPDDIAFQITTCIVVEYVTTKIDPLTKDILKTAGQLIPEPLSKIVSIEDRYNLYIQECCKNLIRKAIGKAKPKQGKNDEEKIESMGEPMKVNESEQMKRTEMENGEKATSEEKGQDDGHKEGMEKTDENVELEMKGEEDSPSKENKENENKEKMEETDENGEMGTKNEETEQTPSKEDKAEEKPKNESDEACENKEMESGKESPCEEKKENEKESEKTDVNGEMEVAINGEEKENDKENMEIIENNNEKEKGKEEKAENTECTVTDDTSM